MIANFDSDYLVHLNRVWRCGGRPPARHMQPINDFIVGLKADGVWAKLKYVHLFSGMDEKSALWPLYTTLNGMNFSDGNPFYSASQEGTQHRCAFSVPSGGTTRNGYPGRQGFYSPDSGFISDGVSCVQLMIKPSLESGFDPHTSFFGWDCRYNDSIPTAQSYLIGAGNNSNGTLMVATTSTQLRIIHWNGFGGNWAHDVAHGGDISGLRISNRTASNALTLYDCRAGALTTMGTSAEVSTGTLTNLALQTQGANFAGTINRTNSRIMGFFLGNGFNATDCGNFSTRYNTLKIALRRV